MLLLTGTDVSAKMSPCLEGTLRATPSSPLAGITRSFGFLWHYDVHLAAKDVFIVEKFRVESIMFFPAA